MRKLVPVFVLLFFAVGIAVAAGGTANAEVGDFTISAGLFGVVVFPGANVGGEYIFAKVDIPGFAPFTFGTALKGGLFFRKGQPYVTVDAMATAHFGLKAFSTLPAWLRGFDWYLGAGLVGTNLTKSVLIIGLNLWTGISYYLNRSLSLYVEFFDNPVFDYYGADLGVKFKL